MESPLDPTAAEAASGGTPQSYEKTSAVHIRNLASLNSSTPTLLLKAATAISLLTNKPISTAAAASLSSPSGSSSPSPAAPSIPPTPEARSEEIYDIVYQILLAINQIRALLHKEIDDMLTEGLIPAEASRYKVAANPTDPDALEGAQNKPEVRDPDAKITNGGLGGLDVGNLNARAAIKMQGDEDMVAKLEGILDAFNERVKAEGDGEKMAVDG